MLSSDGPKSGKKSSQRKAKHAQANKKGEQLNRKAASSQDPKPDQSQAIPEETDAPVAASEVTASEVAASPVAASEVTASEVTVAEVAVPEVAVSEAALAEVAVAEVAPAETPAPLPSPADTPPTAPVASEEDAAVSYRTIADAWGNYSRMSLEQTRSYFEKLAGVRSLGGAFEVQAEFARQACETFIAESQRIRELHGELTRQRLKRLEGFMEKMTQSTSGRRS